MRIEKAVESLEELKVEAATSEVMGGEYLTAWKGKVRGVLSAALGESDHLVERFDKVRCTLSARSTNTPTHYFDQARKGGIRNACGVIDAAIYQLRLKLVVD